MHYNRVNIKMADKEVVKLDHACVKGFHNCAILQFLIQTNNISIKKI